MDSNAGPGALPKLLPGDKAPEFKVKRFLKGDPVQALAPGKVHVVEFWASWCGPCVQQFPHLSKLQAEHPDVTIIGVGILDPESALEKALAKHGANMNYRVAVDADGHMQKAWHEAGGAAGIPDAMIVDAEGRIAWIGFPSNLDGPLAKVKAGSWNVESFRQAYITQMTTPPPPDEMAKLKKRLQDLLTEGKNAEAIDLCDTTVAAQPDDVKMVFELHLLPFKLQALAKTDAASIVALGRTYLDKPYSMAAHDYLMNLSIACDAVDRDIQAGKITPKTDAVFQLSLQALARVEEYGKRFKVEKPADWEGDDDDGDQMLDAHPLFVAERRAAVYAAHGDMPAAVAAMKVAIEASKTVAMIPSDYVDSLREKLREYETGTTGAAA